MAHYTDWPEYPTALLDLTDYPTQTDDVDDVDAWLINALVHEMIAVQKELGTLPKGGYADVKARLDAVGAGYVDRGDNASYDFVLANFTTDGTWRDLDLSSIVPAGAIAVNLNVGVTDDLVNQDFMLRKNGNSYTYNISRSRTFIANVAFYQSSIIGCDANRKIEYYASNTTWTNIQLSIKGWWK